MDCENGENLPPNVQALLAKATCSMLPKQSQTKYEDCYQKLLQWKQEENVGESFSENVIMAYFCHLAETKKNATLWSHYSMLKTMMKVKLDIDIDNCHRLKAFLKQNGVGEVTKKSKTLSDIHIQTFLLEAPDQIHLATKVALIFGVCGALRSCELIQITMDDLERQGSLLKINIPRTKNHVSKFFIVDEKFLQWVNKYISMRPENCRTNRFFLNFQKGKCTNQPIGKNKLAKFPGEISKFLRLPDAASYTGHCFRRTSATLLANAGADIEAIKRHGKWKSPEVARGYIDDSVQHSKETTKKLTSTIVVPSSSNENDATEPIESPIIEEPSSAVEMTTGTIPFSIVINNCPNLQLSLKK